MKTTLIWLAVTLFVSLGSQPLHAQLHPRSVKIKLHRGALYDVFSYLENGDSVNLTQFKEPWVDITNLTLSPDSSLFFFRYKKLGKAYRLALYDFQTFEKLDVIVPGFGGSFEWNSNNQIIHRWGCGTNCANLRVYNSALKEIFFTLSSGGFELSPDKTLVSQFSMHFDRIWIFDLNTLNRHSIPMGYTQSIDHPIDWDYFSFRSNELIILDHLPAHNIKLRFVEWRPLDPDTIGQYYLREEV